MSSILFGVIFVLSIIYVNLTHSVSTVQYLICMGIVYAVCLGLGYLEERWIDRCVYGTKH